MLRSICVVAVATGLAMSAQATVTTIGTLTMYTTQAEFTAALAALGETAREDNFDTLGTSLGGSIVRSAGDLGYTASSIKFNTGELSTLARTGTGGNYALTTVPVTAGRRETTPGNYLDFSGFASGVNAAGVFVGELGSSSAQLVVQGSDINLGLGHGLTLAPGTNFVGYISTEKLTDLQVYVRNWPAGIEPVVTNLYLAAPAAASDVPEPATWAMMLCGFGVIGAAIRRRTIAVRFA
ncbi:PEPxxWA-CTERM sorting domain-containing protein [Sphingomonas sp. AP4-R1]|uniref:PEPxxWA-CTERM sorting domain-containing protein n=1 Tax=Sphingomonas sp. AP4-R1 TaxID=2735134 RepID=UPI00149365BA|nr:PEPxxWA-CTERM sorting domain-containing protein [Sphingomonas sp. AP4-R1]QJU58543.1 PEPxxWA-CTERM sorting domain-containing protein [Sphingomonas sp. AP4-R1]